MPLDERQQTVAVLAHVAANLAHGWKFRAVGLADIEDIGRTKPNQDRAVLFGDVLLGFFLRFARDANDGSEDADAFLAFLHPAAKLVPCPHSGNSGRVRLLPCDFKDVPEAVIVESAHGVQVHRESIAMPCFKLFNKGFDIGGDYFFRRLGFGCGWLDGGGVCSALHGCFLLGFCRCFSCHAWHVPTCRTPPGEGGAARRNGVGNLPPLERKRSWNGKGEAKRRSAQAQRGRLGKPLAPRPGGALSEGLVSLLADVSTQNYQGRRCGQERAR